MVVDASVLVSNFLPHDVRHALGVARSTHS
jgi:hypothetical protein